MKRRKHKIMGYRQIATHTPIVLSFKTVTVF